MSYYSPLIILLLLISLSQAILAQEPYTSPESTLETYVAACKAGDYKAAEQCYTKSSRKLLEEQVGAEDTRDPELLKASGEQLASCKFRLEQVNSKRAVMWPNVETVPPILLRIQSMDEGWRIDYHFMANYMQVKADSWQWRNPQIFKVWKTRE